MYGKLKDILYNNGYMPIPIKGKRPIVKNFNNISIPVDGFTGSNIGIVCGRPINPVCAIDIDITNEKKSAYISEYVLNNYGETVYRIGKYPKTMLIYRTNEPFKKLFSNDFSIGRVEILGNGQQFAAYGIHPETKKPFTWPSPLSDLRIIKYTDLPLLTYDNIRDIIIFINDYLSDYTTIKTNDIANQNYENDITIADIINPINISNSEIKEMLLKLNPDCDRNEWIKIGMAIHHETNGKGFGLWDSWSAMGYKYKEYEMLKQWESFGKCDSRPITAAYLKKLSNDIAKEKENIFDKISWNNKRFSDNPSFIEMVVENFLPKNIVSLIYSAGGVGKSTLMLYMSSIIAAANIYSNIEFLNFKIKPGKIVYLTAEDPDTVINNRYIGILKSISVSSFIDYGSLRNAVDENLKIVSTFGNNIHLFYIDKYELKPTKHYFDLIKKLSKIDNLQLLIIDTKTRYSPAEGMGNVIASQEITLYENITIKNNCSIMLLHHSNKSSRDGSIGGSQAYRDATAIFDSVRAAWFLRPLNEKELEREGIKEEESDKYLLLENSKNNYIKKHKPLIVYRNGYSYTARLQTLKNKNLQDEFNEFVSILQKGKINLSQTEIIDSLNCGRRKAINFLLRAEKEELIIKNTSGRSNIYSLTEKGKIYNMEIDSV